MKKWIFAIIIVSIQLTLINAQEWERYKSEELEFIADFPETPKTSVQKVNTAVGELDMYMISSDSNTVNNNYVYYSIIRSDYPKEEFSNLSVEKVKSILDGAVNGAVTNVNGILESDEETKLNGYLGRKIKIKVQGGELFMNAFLVENVMFVAQVICEEGKSDDANIDKFMNAFDIIKVK